MTGTGAWEARIHETARRAYACGATHLAPIFDAVLARRIAFGMVNNRTVQFPRREVASAGRPVLILIGDDDDMATGPTGWRCAAEAAQWAAAAIIQGSGGTAHHSRTAVDAALEDRRVLLIDTSSRFAVPWGLFLPAILKLAILPVDGEHPVLPTRRNFH